MKAGTKLGGTIVMGQRRNLPPLEVGAAYIADDFESFQYFTSPSAGSQAMLRLRLKHGTTIDLPASDEELTRLVRMLADAVARKPSSRPFWTIS